MADAIAPAGTTSPAGQDTTVQTPASPAQAAPATAAVAPSAAPAREPGWLNERLADKEKATTAKLLKELGVTDVSAAKAILAEANAKAEAAKTTEQRLAEAEARAAAAEARANSVVTVASAQAAAMLAQLKPNLQESVMKAAGDDPVAQLREMKRLSDLADELGVDLFPADTEDASKSAAATTTQTPQAAKPAAATTAPAPNMPAGTTAAAVDHKAVYRQLEQDNPVRAAAYLQRYQRQIYPTQ